MAVVAEAGNVVAKRRELDARIIGGRVRAVSVVDGIARCNSIARGGAERIVAWRDHIEVLADDLTGLLGPDIRHPQGRLPGDLLLEGGVPLLESRVLQVDGNVVCRRCVPERLERPS